MALSNPFQTVLEGLLADLDSRKGVNSPFMNDIREMQRGIQGRIQGRDAIKQFRHEGNAQETAPFFSAPPRPRPDPNNPPAISDPRFRPDLPTDPLADTKVAQAGPETMTDGPQIKPLQASPALVAAVIQVESGGDPNALSPKGAIGLMQVLPSTGADAGFGLPSVTEEQLRDPIENVKFGTALLGKMLNRYNGDEQLALIAYNAGHTVADRFNGDVSTLPKETQNYLVKVAKEQGGGTAPGTPAGAPSTVSAAPTPGTPLVAPQGPSAGHADPPPRPQRSKRPAPVTAPELPPADLGPPGMAQAPPQRTIVPQLWTQFLKSRNPEDLASVPKSGLPDILALMGRVARRQPR